MVSDCFHSYGRMWLGPEEASKKCILSCLYHTAHLPVFAKSQEIRLQSAKLVKIQREDRRFQAWNSSGENVYALLEGRRIGSAFCNIGKVLAMTRMHKCLRGPWNFQCPSSSPRRTDKSDDSLHSRFLLLSPLLLVFPPARLFLPSFSHTFHLFPSESSALFIIFSC